uniref:non-specific serine/threonine protein kinase n=1 Tax=Oryza glaberrima TaxID=4538 RepID=I1PST2_ORYGL
TASSRSASSSQATVSKSGNIISPNWDKPVTEHQLNLTQLKLSRDGNLVISNNTTGSILWSTDIVNRTSSATTMNNTTSVVLSNDGNLVVGSSSDVLWQSFDNPSDVLLPGAKFGWNKLTGFTRQIISKKNLIDLGLGLYRVELGNISGQVEINIWSQLTQSLQKVYAQPADPCIAFGTCGPFTICNGISRPFCDCMESFSRKSPQDWELDDRTAGCMRNTQLNCGNMTSSTDVFHAIARVRLPYNPQSVDNATTQSKCVEACLSHCSCNAYSYERSRCSIWHGDLLSVNMNDGIDNNSEDILYLRLAAKDLPGSAKNRTKLNVGVVTAATITSFGLLGGGGFGSVFKGVLNDSTTVAVKKLDGASQGEKQFRAESSETVLNWTTRYNIVIGVARGLSYLHQSCHNCIIHCDIKPENILLNASFVPKIVDFGMATFVGRDFSRVLTTFRGTIGYLALEWISGVAITPKVDVYSFGMVLLEILSGRRNTSRVYIANSNLVSYFPVHAITKLHEGDVRSLVDPKLHGDFSLEEAERVCKVACWCIQDNE